MGLREHLRRWRRLRIQFALILAAAMAPAGVLAILQAVSNAEDAVAQRLELLAADMRRAAEEEQTTFLSIRETMRIAARDILRDEDFTENCEESLRRLVDGDPRLSRAIFLDAEGRSVCGTDVEIDVSERAAWHDFAARPRFVIGEPREGTLSGAQIAPAYYPVNASGTEVAALAVGIDLTYLRGLSASDIASRPFAILGRGGAILSAGGERQTDWLPADRSVLRASFETNRLAVSADGAERRYFIDPIINDQVWAVTATPRLTLFELLWSAQGVLVIAPILLWLIAVVVAGLAIDRLVTRHVQYLQRVTARLGRGELDTEIEKLEGAPSEIRRLGDAIRVMARNLAERDQALQDMVTQQKSLLLEVHHRVKNNLQMISSMMNMQLRRSASDAEQRSLRLVQDRIHGLAMVHQSLYATERLDSVPLNHLLNDICEHLRTSLKPARAQVTLEMELEEITVDTDVATPIALFVTEAMSNVFKHAVGPTGETRIEVRLTREEAGFEVAIMNSLAADPPSEAAEGAPLPLERASGLGSRLMSGFAKQIGGESTLETRGGMYRVTLRAPLRQEPTRFALRNERRERRAREKSQDPVGSGEA